MRKTLVFLILAATLTASVSAAYIPDSEVCENRDGRQLIIKTFALAPDDDPQALVEEPFGREGYNYSFISIVKEEKPFASKKTHSEIVTVETATDDLSEILSALDATLPYDDGEYSGTLALDHTTIQTEASGYSTKSYTVKDVKTYEGLDRNDPSFIPKTTIKNGATLTLQNIDWAVQSTAVSGDALVTAQYMATATYSAGVSYKAADGYVTSAAYTGEIVASGISEILYTVTYVGEAIQAPEPEPEPEPDPEKPPFAWQLICAGVAILAAALAALFFLLRSNVKIYTMESGSEEYCLVGKQRISKRDMTIDLARCDRYPEGTAVIEITRQAVRRLFGRVVKVRLHDGVVSHRIEQGGNSSYWFKVPTSTTEEEEQ